ncbi:MAG: hypothetical protein JO007_08400 [Alphaproteobacteria bacterium]|nr:hypothetical protein [Alphaproteobacteria bacterium]
MYMISIPTLRSSLTKSVAVLIGLSTCAVGPALAATPTVYAGNATITGSGDVVTATRIPVQAADGSILYSDATITFAIASDGKTLVLQQVSIQPSLNLIISNFQAGTYASPAGGSNTWTNLLSGPGIGPAGTTAWSFSANGGSTPQCAYPYSATWYTGPISSNPFASRITAAGITSADYSYGVAGSIVQACTITANDSFNNGDLIGATQTGNSLTIVSFTFDGKDYPTPVSQITYTLSP